MEITSEEARDQTQLSGKHCYLQSLLTGWPKLFLHFCAV